jgi:hypothetical protein
MAAVDEPCPGRTDGGPHCEHWFDMEPCCVCGQYDPPTDEELEAMDMTREQWERESA